MVEVIIDAGVDAHGLPDESAVTRAVVLACRMAGFADSPPSLCVRFADDALVRQLNLQWRGLDENTDVLSFPMQDGPVFDMNEYLGDIMVSIPFVYGEAQRLCLDTAAHVLHLIVHATLHLLGFTHDGDADAAAMQGLERQVMHSLGLHDPYAEVAAG